MIPLLIFFYLFLLFEKLNLVILFLKNKIKKIKRIITYVNKYKF